MKITRIETRSDERKSLLLCRIFTDAGLVGCGESYYLPGAVAAIIHDWMSHRLLGQNALDIEGHWRFLYERATNFGSRGAELRALSAIDLALWDILGKSAGFPVWQLLGGMTQRGVRIYNSSGGPNYGKTTGKIRGSWPGYGEIGESGPYNDYWSAVNTPEEYARELASEGIQGVKMWTLNFAAHKAGGTST